MLESIHLDDQVSSLNHTHQGMVLLPKWPKAFTAIEITPRPPTDWAFAEVVVVVVGGEAAGKASCQSCFGTQGSWTNLSTWPVQDLSKVAQFFSKKNDYQQSLNPTWPDKNHPSSCLAVFAFLISACSGCSKVTPGVPEALPAVHPASQCAKSQLSTGCPKRTRKRTSKRHPGSTKWTCSMSLNFRPTCEPWSFCEIVMSSMTCSAFELNCLCGLSIANSRQTCKF